MRDGWEIKPLGLVSEINYGYTESASFEAVGPRFLRITDIQNDRVDWESVPYCPIAATSISKFRLATGDIVFARTGATTGKSFLVNNPPEAVFASYLIRLRLKDTRLLPEFLSLFFQTESYWQSIKDGSTGSAQGGFNASKLAVLAVPIPPLSEQKRIVAILNEAFESIDTAVANAERNLANARELFDSHLNSIFVQRNEGWKDKTVGELADHSLGKMLDKQKNRGMLKPYLRNLNVRWFQFDLDDILKMPFEDDEHEKYTAVKGDVLICEGGYPGRAAIWESEESIYFQKAIHRVRFKEERYNKWFLYFLYSSHARGKLHQYFTGSGIQHFTGQSLHKFVLPAPPVQVVSKFVEQFDHLFEQTRSLESIYRQKLAYLAELKEAFLQKAFAGELAVRSAENVQEAAE